MKDKQRQIESNIVTITGKVLEEHTIKLITKLTECIAELFRSIIMRKTDKNKNVFKLNSIKHHLPVESRKDTQDDEEIRVKPNEAEDIAEDEMELLSSIAELPDSIKGSSKNKRIGKIKAK